MCHRLNITSPGPETLMNNISDTTLSINISLSRPGGNNGGRLHRPSPPEWSEILILFRTGLT
jgi:hypothetical protein